MNINRLIKTILAATLCCLALTGQAEKTKVVRVMNGNEVVGEFVASNVDYVEVTDPSLTAINGHEYVDLGLPSGLKWATCNMGAEARNEYGNVYFWGDTEPQSSTNNTCKTSGVDLEDFSGNAEYDAARAHWGSTWRVPTKADVEELVANCKFTFKNVKGVQGILAIGPNENHVFFPFKKKGGYAYTWTSTPGEANTQATLVYFIEDTQKIYNVNRTGKYPIRPVSE